MSYVPLIELTRGGTSECLHLGAVAVVNTQGQVLAHAGDPHWQTFTRSTLKALQALPLVSGGGVQQFGLTDSELALMCASHNGEDMHVAQVDSILHKAGVGYKRLLCGCHVPLRYVYTDAVQPEHLRYDERHNNCSGKHAGFLAYCVQHQLPTDHYIDPTHPLQVAVREAVARVVGLAAHDMPMGLDGCSAPNYAMPLSHLARAYARLASGARDSEWGESFEVLARAMTAHPELVSGTQRNDADFMRIGRGDWVTKVGADGVQVVGSRARGEALALKIIDGNKPALFAATVEAMDQLGWLDAAQREALAPWRARDIVNARGLHVGERRHVFQLTRYR